jgi:hypothetical protein
MSLFKYKIELGAAADPHWLMLAVSLPQIIVTVILLSGLGLVIGDISSEQLSKYVWLLGVASFNILFWTGFSIFRCYLKKSTGPLVSLFLLWSQILVLAFCLLMLSEAVPATINNFIFPVETYYGYLFTFFMPGIFYPLLIFAQTPLHMQMRKETLISVIIIAAVTGAVYVVLYLFRISSNVITSVIIHQILFLCVIVVIIILSVIFFTVLLRLAELIYHRIEKHPALMIAYTAVIALVLPLSGLLLNITIPFPVDFQDWRVYAITIINGTVLLIPFGQNRYQNLLLFFSKTALYPFCLYFFLVFLPYLPLAMFAILAAGLGFLMLSPTLLFYVQTRRIYCDFNILAKDFSKTLLLITGIAGIMILPLWYTAGSIRDRIVINQALDFVFSSDYSKSADSIATAKPRIKTVIAKINDWKHGVEMPYLDFYYQWLVFDNLTIPDNKLKEMYEKIFDEEFKTGWRHSSFRQIRRFPRQRLSGLAKHLPNPQISIVSAQSEIKLLDDGTVKNRVRLQIKNNSGNNNSEFMTEIKLPQDVFISGFWLNVDGKEVAGKIFERKSALWIYEMITETSRRDPGLLFYNNPLTVRLHVYPFISSETRQADVEFIYPAQLQPDISIGGIKLDTGRNSNESADNGNWIVMKPEQIATMPCIERQPVLEFIINSKDMEEALAHNGRMLKRIAELFRIREYNLSVAALDAKVLLKDRDIDNMHEDIKLMEQGNGAQNAGFMPERTIKQRLLEWEQRKSPDKFPVIVYICSKPEKINLRDFDYFDVLMPETGFFTVADLKGHLQKFDISGCSVSELNSRPEFKKTFRINLWQILPADKSYVAATPKDNKTLYKQAQEMLKNYQLMLYNPSMKAQTYSRLVSESKKSGIMLPLTSYIVLERSSQWKMLERVEKHKLKNRSELEKDEVDAPAPSALLLILGFAVFYIFYIRVRNHREMSSG